MLIYTKKEFNIYKVDRGFIVHNTNKKFSEGHTHLKSFNFSKQLISNVLNYKKPKTKNGYLLESHKRISEDVRYIKLINDLIDKNDNKKPNYTNINKGIPRKKRCIRI